MYGIMRQDGITVLCHYRSMPGTYVLKEWSRALDPVMIEAAMEIDNLMQGYMVASNIYDLKVFKFTKDQTEEILVRKLKGH